jgi:hypothetical protein
METMNMTRIIPCLLLLSAALVSVQAQAQKVAATPVKSAVSGDQYSGQDFENFTAKEGWVFLNDQSKSAGFPDLNGAPSAIEGGAPFSAADFDPATFDPRDYRIERVADPNLPTNFNVGDRGVIQFHSPKRCQDLYARHLARMAKDN